MSLWFNTFMDDVLRDAMGMFGRWATSGVVWLLAIQVFTDGRISVSKEKIESGCNKEQDHGV